MTLFTASDVAKAYGGVAALSGAGLALRAGEVHALMGENGAGKSTLIRILAGVEQADHASFSLCGQAIRIDGPQAAFAHGFRFIHQELNVVPQLSVAENIFLAQPYPLRAGCLVDWRKLNARATAALARLGIRSIDVRRQMARLGTGDQMLVRIAGALAGEGERQASVFVLDEPTAALTDEESERLFTVIGELTGRGAAVLYVSHRMDEVRRICDRVTVMRDGLTVATLDVADTSTAEIIRLMTGRDLENIYPARRAPIGEEIALDVEALDSRGAASVAFTLRKGEILGLAGLANAGQSEIVKALMGAQPARITGLDAAGRRLGRQTPPLAWAQGFALVPRERRREGLVLSRSITENIALPWLRSLSRGEVFLDRKRQAREAAGLAGKVRLKAKGLSQPCRHLSGGNQQKVVFARALAGSPSVLLLDEPTRGVDVGARAEIYALIREWSAAGRSIVMASSDLPELLGLCDRILVMRDGRQSAIVPAAGLTQAGLLHLFYAEPGREAA